MGRHPKSLQEHIEDGTYRADRHGQVDPSRFSLCDVPTSPDPPASLSGYAVSVWNRLYPILTDTGVLTDAERETFVAYCEAAGLFDRACEEIKKSGIMLKRKRKTGKTVRTSFGEEQVTEDVETINPWNTIKREAAADLLRAASLLGLTPVDRGRVLKAKQTGKAGVPVMRPKSLLRGRATPLPPTG